MSFKVKNIGAPCRLSLRGDDPKSLKYMKKCKVGLVCVYKSYNDTDILKYDGQCIAETDIGKVYSP